MPDLFDYAKAKAARDAGIDRVMKGEEVFKVAIAKYIDNLPHGWVGTGEDIRRAWTGVQPHHVNCWGAICFAAVKRGTLMKFPNIDMRRPEGVKSHGRPTYLYRRV
jgi:hypothetical protein